jgi:diguanylate cyclase (GGDEF)-like protein
LDLEGFKHVNDTYGHVMGDGLLRTVAEFFQICIRDTDTLARFGGDEFLLILTEISEESQVINIARKIINRVAEGFVLEGKKLMVTLSVGISLYPEDGADLLVEKADSAMYYVKRHGKNNFKVFDDRLKIKK